jgi:hypothetical protein
VPARGGNAGFPEAEDGGKNRRKVARRAAGEPDQRNDFLIFLCSLFKSLSNELTVFVSWAAPLRALSSASCAASAAFRAAFSAASAAPRAALSVLPMAAPMDFAALFNVNFLAILSSTLPAAGRPNVAPS